jgi:hypothetical protein
VCQILLSKGFIAKLLTAKDLGVRSAGMRQQITPHLPRDVGARLSPQMKNATAWVTFSLLLSLPV